MIIRSAMIVGDKPVTSSGVRSRGGPRHRGIVPARRRRVYLAELPAPFGATPARDP
jgi:hypothetical protein